MDRRSFVQRTTAAALFWPVLRHLDGGMPVGGTEGARVTSQSKRCLYGAMITPDELPAVSSLATHACEAIVMASGVFWGSVEPRSGALDFGRAERVLQWAEQNAKVVRGHTLVYHKALPPWLGRAFVAKPADGVLEQHVHSIASHFAGRVRYWDVLNEVIIPQHGQQFGLRRSIFFDQIGPSYVDLAMRAARQSDPKALLGYNEYGLEDDSANADRKRKSVLQLLRHFREKDVPVDYLGIQAHLTANQAFSLEKLGDFLREVEHLGIRILVTELDVNDQDLVADVSRRDALVADTYKRFLEIVLASVTPDMVTTWGLTDNASWQQTEHPRSDWLEQRPLPFDSCFRAKPAWAELVRLNVARDFSGTCTIGAPGSPDNHCACRAPIK